jgi:hypothetical protein
MGVLFNQESRAMANTSKKNNRGNQGGSANRRDDEGRGQRTQGRNDRAQQGDMREDSGRSGSRSGGSGGGEGRNRKGNNR